jgi:hypothetical protein|tara:strand:- start:268 stop:384 length:117 start_codon:yes stop_codon:yes gene_type:complete
MKKVIAISRSLYDAMIFGAWTIGPVMVFLWAIGFIQIA